MSEGEQGMTKTQDRNESDRKLTAPGHLPKWILLQNWMLQYWQDLPDLWGKTVACVSKTTHPPLKDLSVQQPGFQ